MANRAERRSQSKRGRGANTRQRNDTRVRSREGMLDEYALQERSRRLEDNATGQWRPSSSTTASTVDVEDVDIHNPKLVRRPHSVRQWFRIVCWALNCLSIVAFFVVMWLPQHPMWLIIAVSSVFAVGVLSLFLVAGNAKDNPNLDDHGTAI